MNFGANFVQRGLSSTKKEQTQKDLQGKIAHVAEELKRHILNTFFALNGVLENGECVLDSP